MSARPLLPSLQALKDQAKRLRGTLNARGGDLSHGQALELIARQYGYRDWNTLHAALGNRRDFDPYALGSRVRGAYLGQPFEGRVLGVQAIPSRPDLYRLVLDFDQAVDVVRFESFSAFRKRVTCTIDASGCSPARTSDGRPQVELLW
ncbi:glyoxalase superfamily protein [Rhizobium sp. YIM 134829]|uniref:glyoxalase superfamily protein n=1 Tax=Rhizobium sp. YIM 134829 TaxID=3390453 RepID=UPI00397D6794